MGMVKVPGIDLILPAEPFYVGKGAGSRKNAHLWESTIGNTGNDYKDRKIKKIIASGETPIIVQLNSGLPENMALQNEVFLIKKIGRANLNKGPLTNLTDGGDGPSGRLGKKKSIVVYNPKTQELSFHKSLKDFLEGGDSSKAGDCCRGNNPQYKGLILFYQKDYTKKYLDRRIALFEHWEVEYAKRYITRKKYAPPEKPIIVYDFLTDTLKKYPSSREYLGNKYPVGITSVRECCRGIKLHFKGKIILYHSEFNEDFLSKRKLLLLRSNLSDNTKILMGI